MSALSTKARQREIAEIEAWEKTPEGETLLRLQHERQFRYNVARLKQKVQRGTQAHKGDTGRSSKVKKSVDARRKT